MTAIDFDTALTRHHAPAAGGLFAQIAAKFDEFLLRRKTRMELESLSDDMLSDIGITRGEINDIVSRV